MSHKLMFESNRPPQSSAHSEGILQDEIGFVDSNKWNLTIKHFFKIKKKSVLIWVTNNKESIELKRMLCSVRSHRSIW